MCKRSNKKRYGHAPEKVCETIKWNRVNIDCCGPKTVKHKDGYKYELRILTMIDPVTGWFELRQLLNTPTADDCQKLFDST